MSTDIKQELKQSFHLAGLRKLADESFTRKDRIEALKVIKRFDKSRRKAVSQYYQTYANRVDEAILRLMNKAGAADKDLTNPAFGQDRFNKSALRFRAEREVRFAHLNAMSRFDVQETRALEVIQTNARKKSASDTLEKDFARAIEQDTPDLARRPSTPDRAAVRSRRR